MLNDVNGNTMTAARVIILLLAAEMELDAERQIWLTNQNRKIPNDTALYITAGMVDSRVVSNFRTTEPTDAGMDENQIIVMQENIQIDIFSRGNDAEFRRWEVVAALQSVYSQQLQEQHQFKIFRIPSSFINSSTAEGGSNINRFSVIVSCHVWYKKTKAIGTPTANNFDYFEEFETRVDDAESIETDTGIIELTLTED